MSRWNAKHFVGMNGVGDLSRYIVGETTKRASLCSHSVENELLARDAVSTYICIMQIEFLAWILLLLLTTKPFITLHAFSNNYYSGIAKFLTESILVIDFIYTYVLIFGMNECWILKASTLVYCDDLNQFLSLMPAKNMFLSIFWVKIFSLRYFGTAPSNNDVNVMKVF